MNRIRSIILMGSLLIAGVVIFTVAARGQLTSQTTDEGIRLLEDGQPILVYRHRPVVHEGHKPRSHYIHPLYNLSGEVITEDFPDDHPHQRGIFWAWHQVKVDNQRAGDGWLTEDFQWDVRQTKVTRKDDSALVLAADVVWSSPDVTDRAGSPRPLVRESMRIEVHPQQDDRRNIDFDIRLHAALDELAIGGSEDEKGYGGFSARFRLPNGLRFLSTEGTVIPERTALQVGPWIDLTATFGSTDQKSGVTLLCHPSSEGFPQPWILRSQDSMQNAVFPGRHCRPLKQGEPWTLRYRLVLHRGEIDEAQGDAWQAEFAKMSFEFNSDSD